MLGHSSVATTLSLYAHVTRVGSDGLTASINAGSPGVVPRRPKPETAAKWTPAQQTRPKLLLRKGVGWCRGRDSNPYKVALTSPSS